MKFNGQLLAALAGLCSVHAFNVSVDPRSCYMHYRRLCDLSCVNVCRRMYVDMVLRSQDNPVSVVEFIAAALKTHALLFTATSMY